MKFIKPALTYLFGAFMILGGIAHFTSPEMYLKFLPEFLPRELINILAGVAEIAVGIGVFIPRTRSWATLGILVMMLAFLPLHIIDVFKADPAIGSHEAALIRLPLQFVFIAWAWYINRREKTPG
ncbi:MAG: hypothetical protein EAZ89_06805 [Bacteroidetes bacterium]|nr:MAG: hypothetical protein EAZ89_06805 [Bacteroidota bacterium]